MGIARGGLIAAAMLSYRLDIKRVLIIQLASYEEEESGDVRLVFAPPLEGNQKVLIVDDIADSGKTLHYLNDYYGEKLALAKSAVLLQKPWSNYQPDHYAREVDAWVEFFWEEE